MRKEDTQQGHITPNLLEQMHYETRDINLSRILSGVGALFVFIFVTLIVSFGIYQFFIPDFAKVGVPQAPSPVRPLPPHPQIQTEPKEDLTIFRRAEDGVIETHTPDADGKKQAMTPDQAIDALATQQGISGVHGDAVRGRGAGYPGMTSATGAPAPAEHGESNVPGGETAPKSADMSGEEGHGGEHGGH